MNPIHVSLRALALIRNPDDLVTFRTVPGMTSPCGINLMQVMISKVITSGAIATNGIEQIPTCPTCCVHWDAAIERIDI